MAYKFTPSDMAGFPQEDVSLFKVGCQRKLWCAWEDRLALEAELLGYTQPPQTYPYRNAWGIKCVHVHHEGVGKVDPVEGDSTLAQYERAIVTADYESYDFGDPQPYPELLDPGKSGDPTKSYAESIEPGIESLPLCAGDFNWAGGAALKSGETPYRQSARMAYTLTRFWQPHLPNQDKDGNPLNVFDLRDHINAVEILPIGWRDWSKQGFPPSFTFPKHTLMLVSITPTPSPNDATGKTLTIAYRFLAKMGKEETYNTRETWRHYWRGDLQCFATMIAKKTGLPYESPPEAHFGILFP